MQQLCGSRPIQTGYIPFLYWPTLTNTITKGENGGVCFFGGSQWPTGPCYGLIEVANNQVYCYNSLNGNNNVTTTSLLAFDFSSNYLYSGIRITNFNNPFELLKFDNSQYTDLSHSDLIYLDINEVQALMLGDADFAWDLSNPAYTVPKNQNSSPLFAASMWMGGYNNGQLHMSAMTYRQSGVDFWSGPLDTLSDSTLYLWGNLYNPNTSPNRPVWKINRYDVANFIYNWNAGNVQNGTFLPPPNFLSWPGNGTGNYAHNLAPYVDVNGNNIYDPMQGGDYPLIKGDQMIWWVFNDNAAAHAESGGKAFGAEIHASAYAYVCPNIADSNRALNYTTFYNYKIYNRSSKQYDTTFVGLWIDADLGNYQDDYIGCDVMNNYGFIYNGDNYDEDAQGHTGYHTNLPVFACNILKAPKAIINDGVDNNNNGVIDETNEECLMSSFGYYTNTGNAQTGNPTNNAAQYLDFITNKWRDGSPLTFGGNGTNAVGPLHPEYHFAFPGKSDPYGIGAGGSISNPVTLPDTNWTQYNAGVVKGDMRYLLGVGPFTMQPHGVYEIDYALVFSQDSANCYGNNICVLTRAEQDNIRVKNWFNTNNFPSCLSLNGIGIHEIINPQNDLKVYPNPASNYVYIEFKETQPNVILEIIDMLGNVVKAGVFTETQKYIAVPIEDLSKGVYAVKIKLGNTFEVKKFIKE